MHAIDFLSFDERDDLMAFLKSLSAPLPDDLGPPPEFAKAAQK
jgi:hypothetical protein